MRRLDIYPSYASWVVCVYFPIVGILVVSFKSVVIDDPDVPIPFTNTFTDPDALLTATWFQECTAIVAVDVTWFEWPRINDAWPVEVIN